MTSFDLSLRTRSSLHALDDFVVEYDAVITATGDDYAPRRAGASRSSAVGITVKLSTRPTPTYPHLSYKRRGRAPMVAAIEQENEQEYTAVDRDGLDQFWTVLRQIAAWMRQRQDRIRYGYLIPERSGLGCYVIAKEPAFDFELNRELVAFGSVLIRKGVPIHTILLPGSVEGGVPRDGIVVHPTGKVSTYAD